MQGLSGRMMSSRAEQLKLAQALLELSEVDMTEVLRWVFENREPDPTSPVKRKYVLGVVPITLRKSLSKRYVEHFEQEPKTVQLIPYVNWEGYSSDFVFPDGYYEFGQCSACQVEFAASYKSALCPICNKKARLT